MDHLPALSKVVPQHSALWVQIGMWPGSQTYRRRAIYGKEIIENRRKRTSSLSQHQMYYINILFIRQIFGDVEIIHVGDLIMTKQNITHRVSAQARPVHNSRKVFCHRYPPQNPMFVGQFVPCSG